MEDFDLAAFFPTSFGGTKGPKGGGRGPGAGRGGPPASLGDASARGPDPEGEARGGPHAARKAPAGPSRDADELPRDAERPAGTSEGPADTEDWIGPLPPDPTKHPGPARDSDDDDDDSGGSDSDAEGPGAAGRSLGAGPAILPLSHEITLQSHAKPITALQVDPSGNRVLSGAFDNDVKLWDFSGMDMGLRPFRTFEPFEGNPIRDLRWSNSGDKFLACSTSNQTTQAKLFDREGTELQEYARGDAYIRDMRHTKGHVAAINCLRWHPSDKASFLSSSNDSTLRVWDVEDRFKQKAVVVVRSGPRGSRTGISVCTFSPDGALVSGASTDGFLRIYSLKSPWKAAHEVQAHLPDSEPSTLSYSRVNPHHVLTRASDDFVKIWDLRNLKGGPVASRGGLTSYWGDSNADWSPDCKHVVVGLGGDKGQDAARLLVLDAQTFDIKEEVDLGATPPARITWHSKLNQILVGCTDGGIKVLYDPQVSIRGAKLCVARPQRRKVDSYVSSGDGIGPILTPHALPMYKDAGSDRLTKRQRERQRQDPLASSKPVIPSSAAHGKGGQIASRTAHQQLLGFKKTFSRDEDPRAAILKHAKDAAENPYWISPAYQKTQPKAVFRDPNDKDGERDVKRRK